MHHSQNKWQAVTAYVSSLTEDTRFTQGKTLHVETAEKPKRWKNRLRGFIWYVHDASRFTASQRQRMRRDLQ